MYTEIEMQEALPELLKKDPLEERFLEKVNKVDKKDHQSEILLIGILVLKTTLLPHPKRNFPYFLSSKTLR